MIRSLLRGSILIITSYLGAWIGMLLISFLVIRPAVERQRAERPDQIVCGNPFVPPLLAGYIIGSGIGLWAGYRLCQRYLRIPERATDS